MLLTILLSLAVVVTFVGSLYLLILGLKSGTMASRYFSLYLFLFSATIVSVYTVTDPQNFIPIHLQNLFSLLFYVMVVAIPPTLYNYIILHLNIDKPIHKRIYLFALLLLAINLFAFFYLTLEVNYDAYTVNLITEVMTYANFIAYLFIFPILTIYYFFLCIRSFRKGNKASHDSRVTRRYIRDTGITVFGYGVFLLLFIAMQSFGGTFYTTLVKIYLFGYTVALIIQGYSLIYAQSHISIEEDQTETIPVYFQEMGIKLTELMDNEQPFLDPKLTLHQLARMAETNEKYLSAFLNETYKQNFFSFINDYRIRYAKTLLSDPMNDHFTIESIGNMAGFHSKSSFNSAFKKSTGVTPSEFKKRL